MKMINLEAVKKIGEEYGWEDRLLEETLANSIKFCYSEKGMHAEVDVNLGEGTIAVRRRSGIGDKGVWIDIDNPLMPSMQMFMSIMEDQQWGKGDAGRILEADVAGYRDGGVIYRVSGQFVIVPENLLSVADYKKRPTIGEKQIIVLCSSQDQHGLKSATRRGKEFVGAVMECYYPNCISNMWMGASNSWAVIKMKQQVMDEWMAEDGANLRYLQKILGIRRITLIPESEREIDTEREQEELNSFVASAWKGAEISKLEGNNVTIAVPLEEEIDPRKMRTFVSMLKKISPEREFQVV
ncbi:MAG: hypothetical protein GY793_11325 [Proteobacteria bacterium]|nr:hypothetical protein [Pseudomonadota bacterium]